MLEALPLEVERRGAALRRRRDRRDRRAAAGRDARRVPRRATPSARRGRRAALGRRSRRGPSRGCSGCARRSTSTRTSARATQGDVDLVIVRELVGGLYFGARGVRDDGTVFDTCEYTPGAGRAHRPPRVRARARPPQLGSCRSTRRTCSTPRACGARVVDEVAPEYPGRRAPPRARRQLCDGARQLHPRRVRRRRDREHVRRHPLGRRRRGHRRARPGRVGEPRRRRAGDLRAGARLGARHRRHRAPRTRRRCSARSRCCSSTRSSERDLAAALVEAPSTTRSSSRRRPISAATRTTTQFGDAVLASTSRRRRMDNRAVVIATCSCDALRCHACRPAQRRCPHRLPAATCRSVGFATR